METSYRHIYAHFPFCEVICHYCDFYTARAKEARQEDFFQALFLETEKALPHFTQPLSALYLGGGTPSVSPLDLLDRFLGLFQNHINSETEITLEANPTNINATSLAAWKKMGINRLSLGIQSLNDQRLKKLGRVHSAEMALNSLRLAREYFDNVNGDLIYGVPGQELEEPAQHGEQLVRAGATHISAYHLTLPQSHFLHSHLPADDFSWQQIDQLAQRLAPHGFEHYEVSNFALPGKASRNNSNYWQGGPYWALGPSAHGFDGKNSRWKNVADWQEYIRRIQAGECPIGEKELLSLEQRRIETLFTSLRTRKGLFLEGFQREFGEDIASRHGLFLQKLEKEGLGRLANGHFMLTFSGKMLTDEIVHKLL